MFVLRSLALLVNAIIHSKSVIRYPVILVPIHRPTADGILPRAKKHATGMFFARPLGGPLSSNLIIHKNPIKKTPRKAEGFFMGWIMGFEPTTFRATI